MTLLGVRNYGRRLRFWRRAWLLCWLMLCGSWAALSMVPQAPVNGASGWCLVCEVWLLAVVSVDCRCSLSFVFLGGARCLELSPCYTEKAE